MFSSTDTVSALWLVTSRSGRPSPFTSAAVTQAGAKSVEGKKALDKITKLVDKFKAQADKLEKSLDQSSASAEKHAKHFRDGVIPNMTALRELGDELENMMPHELWPLATYREMLFIK